MNDGFRDWLARFYLCKVNILACAGLFLCLVVGACHTFIEVALITVLAIATGCAVLSALTRGERQRRMLIIALLTNTAGLAFWTFQTVAGSELHVVDWRLTWPGIVVLLNVLALWWLQRRALNEESLPRAPQQIRSLDL